MNEFAVYKYSAPIEDEFQIVLPRGAEILSVQVQRGTPCLWARVCVDEDGPTEVRRFAYVGTGHRHPKKFWEGFKFVGTVQLEQGALVFHLFEIR